MFYKVADKKEIKKCKNVASTCLKQSHSLNLKQKVYQIKCCTPSILTLATSNCQPISLLDPDC